MWLERIFYFDVEAGIADWLNELEEQGQKVLDVRMASDGETILVLVKVES